MARAHSFQLRGSSGRHPDLQRESSTDSAESLEAMAKTLKGGHRSYSTKNINVYTTYKCQKRLTTQQILNK